MEHAEYDIYVCPKPPSLDWERLLKFQNDNFPDSRWSGTYFDTFFSGHKRCPILVMLSCDGDLAGFAVGRLEKDNPDIFLSCLIVVAHAHRGKAYGKELIRHLFRAVIEQTQAEKIVLHFRAPKNLGGYYTNMGFGNMHTRGAYKNGDLKQYMDISRSDIMKHIG